MLDTLTFAELEAQEPELLPPRTVLSLVSMTGSNCNFNILGCTSVLNNSLNNNCVNVLVGGVFCKTH